MVEGVLDRIEAAIAQGAFDAFVDLSRQLEDAMATLPAGPPDAVRVRAAHVARRLHAVAGGVRAAQWRLEDIRAMGRNGDRLVTYDGQGRRQDAGTGGQIARRV